jgi:hypothetical protein
MDAPTQPNKKRLRRIADQLEQMVRVDMVKGLGDRGLDDAVYRILRHLTLAEIWEVISHSPPMRQWMHRKGVWKKLAEARIPEERLTNVIRELKSHLSKTRGINYMWIILAFESEIFDSKEAHVMRKWKTKYGEPCVQITGILHNDDVMFSFERAFPNGHAIYAEVLEKTDINGKRAVVPVLEITYNDYDEKNDEYYDDDYETAFVVFWYFILASGGKAMAQSFEGGVLGLSKEMALDMSFFEMAHTQLVATEFKSVQMLPEGEETYKSIRFDIPF